MEEIKVSETRTVFRTIEDAKQQYRQGKSEIAGYRDLVTLLIDSGFQRPFANDSYYDALILTEAMFKRSERSIRLLTGGGVDGFISELAEPFSEALEKVKTNGGEAKVIVLSDQGQGSCQTLHSLQSRFPETVKIAFATPMKPLRHFIVCDSRIVRVEEPHPLLTDQTSAHEVKAEVHFNNPEKAKMLETFFDAVWSSVAPQTR